MGIRHGDVDFLPRHHGYQLFRGGIVVKLDLYSQPLLLEFPETLLIGGPPTHVNRSSRQIFWFSEPVVILVQNHLLLDG